MGTVPDGAQEIAFEASYESTEEEFAAAVRVALLAEKKQAQ